MTSLPIDLRVAPPPTSTAVRDRFRRQGRRDTGPERAVRCRRGGGQQGPSSDAVLTGLGRRVLRCGEHEDPDAVVDRICPEPGQDHTSTTDAG